MPFSRKICRDWYIDFLIENNYDIEFWDLSDISNYQDINIKSYYDNNITVHKNFSYKNFEKMLRENKKIKIIYVVVVSFHRQTSKIYTILKKINPYTVFFNWGETPEGGISYKKKSFIEKISMIKNNQLPFKGSLLNLFGLLYCKYLKVFDKIKIHDIYFNAGNYANVPPKAKKIININLCDYDQFISNKNIDKSSENSTVFIDSNLVSNSDIKLNGLKQINQERYLASLNRFFDMFEKKYNTNIIISAHPTSEYNTDQFNGRKIYRLKTAELISNAKYVLSHHSTAVSYAVLNYKPIIFLTINDWEGEYEDYAIKEFSKSLKSSFINIDNIKSNDDIEINCVVKNIYDQYKYNFVVSKESEGLQSSKIILNEFNTFYAR